MKKLILFLLLIIFALTALIKNMQAQLITNDKNWNSTPFFNDNFTPLSPDRVWDSNWVDYPNNYQWMADYLWIVTHGAGEHQVVQRENAIFNEDDSSTIKLRATYEGWLDSTYSLPPSQNFYGGFPAGWHEKLYYYSGAITTLEPILYGYFETRCKFPVSRGSFPAFWLWGGSGGNYREIDIFEYSWLFNNNYGWSENDSARQFNGGIWYSNNSPYNTRYGDHGYIIPPSDPDLLNFHTYGLEWSPKYVTWYFDNKVIGEYYGDSVPSQSMYLLLNYSLDERVIPGGVPIQWPFPNNMIVDYVKVNKLKCGCDTNTVINSLAQLNSYYYSVKNTITVDGNGTTITVPSGSKVVLRAKDGITITKDFEVPLGSELDLITHPCPDE